MNLELGGWLWFVVDVLFVVVLGAAMVYGAVAYRRRSRNRNVEQNRDEATRELYRRER
jgi:heme/copper-type cytochrome/quinol oxidase subunit 2